MLLGSPVPGTGLGAQSTSQDCRNNVILSGPLFWSTSLHLSLPTEIVVSDLQRGSFPIESRKCRLSWLLEEIDTCGVSTFNEILGDSQMTAMIAQGTSIDMPLPNPLYRGQACG